MSQDPTPPKSREQLLFAAFTNLPQEIGGFPVRRISPYTYSLLENLESPLLGRGDPSKVIESVAEFIWMHHAPIDEVIKVETRQDLPVIAIKRISISLDISETYEFIKKLGAALEKVAAAVAVAEEDEAGKPRMEESPPTGSPASSSPQDAPEIPSANIISFTTPPSSAPSSISTPPTSPPELLAAGSMTSPETPQLLPVLPSLSPDGESAMNSD